MKFADINVIAPTLYPDEVWNEAEVFGAITWLWLKSEHYKLAPIESMAAYVLPILKNKQFALFSRGIQPVAYISWAYFSPATETEYIKCNTQLFANLDWNTGNRMWVIDWFAPLGDSLLVKSLMEQYLFPNSCFRALYHKGNKIGLRVKTFSGRAVTFAEQQNWIAQHPIVYPNT